MAPFLSAEHPLDAASTIPGSNDLEPIARRRYPEIDQALRHLERFATARMTGSGSAVFAALQSRADAEHAVGDVPPHWRVWVARGVNEHPLSVW